MMLVNFIYLMLQYGKIQRKKIDKGILIPKWRAVDIDNLEDWVQSKINFKYLRKL